MREVVSLVFGIMKAKLTIAKDERGKVDFFREEGKGDGLGQGWCWAGPIRVST